MYSPKLARLYTFIDDLTSQLSSPFFLFAEDVLQTDLNTVQLS